MMWAICYLESLKVGVWPPEMNNTGYVDTVRVQSSRNKEARFIKPAIIAAEVEWRLKRTGIEGKLLVSEIRQGLMLEELQPESRNALNYISGWDRRRQSYQVWKKQRTYRGKIKV